MALVWMILSAVILIILILFPFTSVRIHLIYRRKAEKDHLEFRFRLFFGWIRFRIQVPSLQLQGSGVTVRSKEKGNMPGSEPRRQKLRITWRKLRNLRHRFARLQQRILQLNETLMEAGRRFMSRVVCERLEWETLIGTGDAASTGIVTGMIWGVKYTLIGFAGSHIRWEKAPRIEVQPLFNTERIETCLESIFRFRIGHAILAVIRLLVRLLQNQKGGEGSWQNTRFKA
ncbi:DUF2953 domain-containing protein [Kroppenstedtia eburnea]|uniref:DUF2953 domain-containing protein n=1 Tax=Kroppenstedtia eburnea TaxID=714067 RepID=A0A1N7IP13_9BACL|nr:DUF2953 domain-containing protein [Kroppenstedtia eburnea]QKI82015.1 DUF2953 domain-containing protein [Kroppenstedtia eburnea]SIS38711.1 Protein of unknown function [Kroppenstedtia eburnea]